MHQYEEKDIVGSREDLEKIENKTRLTWFIGGTIVVLVIILGIIVWWFSK